MSTTWLKNETGVPKFDQNFILKIWRYILSLKSSYLLTGVAVALEAQAGSDGRHPDEGSGTFC